MLLTGAEGAGDVGIKGFGRVALVAAVLSGTLVSASATSVAQGAGSKLVEEVVSHEVGDNAQVRLESAADFAADGGDAIFEPGTANEEPFSYDYVDLETARLIGLTRPSAANHPVGAFVEAVSAQSPDPSPSASGSEPSADPGNEPDGSADDEPDSTDAGSSDATDDVVGPPSMSAGVIPDPCDTVECDVGNPCSEGLLCDLVDAIVATVEQCTRNETCDPPGSSVVESLIYDLCGSENVSTCDDEISRALAAAIAELCPYGITTCADPTINYVADIVMDIVCPSGSLGYCIDEIGNDVNEQVAAVVAIARGLVTNLCGSDTSQACIDSVMALLDAWVFRTVCGSSNPFTCVANLQDSINDAVANACESKVGLTSPTEDSAVVNCTALVLATVENVLDLVSAAMITACGSDQAVVCASNLIQRLNAEINGICASLPGERTTTGTNECIDKAMQIVNSGLEAAKQKMRDVCRSDNATTCATNLVNDLLVLLDRVNDLVANACNSQIGATTSTTDSAVTNCINRVLQTVAEVQALVYARMVEVCGSSDPNACAANLVARINVEINRICASLPGDRNTTGLNECIDKTLQVVNVAVEAAKAQMRAVCGSDTPTTCANNLVNQIFALLDRVNDLVANTCNHQIGATTSTTDSAVNECLDRVFATVATVQQLVAQKMVEVCGSSDPNACAANLLRTVDQTVGDICGLVPVTDGAPVPADYPGFGACIQKAVATINFVMMTICGSADLGSCADNLRDALESLAATVDDIVVNTCDGRATADPAEVSATGACTTRVLETIADVRRLAEEEVAGLCGSLEPATCVSSLVADVDAALADIVRPVCSEGITSCKLVLETLIQELIASAYRFVCAEDIDARSCLDRHGALVTALVDYGVGTVYRAACPVDTSATACLARRQAEAIDLARMLLRSGYDVVCEPGDPLIPADLEGCADAYADYAGTVLAGASGGIYDLVCGGQALLLACIKAYGDPAADLVEQLTGDVYGLVCTPSSTSNDCINRYVGVLLGAVNDILESYCPQGTASCHEPYRDVADEAIALISSVDEEVVVADPGTACPEGPPPWAASDLPPVIPARCDLVGLAIHDGTIGAHVPLPGEGVTATMGLQRFRIAVQVDGTVLLMEVGDEGPEPAIMTIPSAPTNATASGTSSQTVALSWTDNSTNESGFAIDRRMSTGAKFQRVATVPANRTAFTDSGLASSTAYYYRVVAYNEGGSSAPSNEANATTHSAPAPPPLPNPPHSLSASAASSAQINLQWVDGSDNESGFIVERAQPGGAFAEIARLSANSDAYADRSLEPRASHGYRVRAFNSAGMSAYSNEAWATTDYGAGQSPPPETIVVEPTPTPSAAPSAPPPSSSPTPTVSPTPVPSAAPDPDADDVDLETGQAGTGGCKDDFYELIRTGNGLQRLYGKLSWKFVRGSYPDYFTEHDKRAAIERFKDGGQHMARAYTTCRGDWAKKDPVPNGIGFVEDGTTDNPADFDRYDVPGDGDKKEELRCGEARREGTKNQRITHDGISQIEFGPIPAAAGTCNWDEHTPSGPEKIIESDLRFAPNPFGSAYPGGQWFTAHDVPPGCQNKADLEGVTTHERGHSMGLDDVYDNGNGHPGLTMGATNDNCRKASRSLGKGDFLGLKDLYSR